MTLPLIIALLAASPPTPDDWEPKWSKWIASEMGENHVAEHRLPDGTRVDVLGPKVAWEVEWCSKGKVYEAVGQALYYRAVSDREGGVILLMGKKPLKQEITYLLRCTVACREAGLKLRTVNVNHPELEE